MFLPSLKIGMKLSCFVGSYLDVVFYKRLSGDGYETFVRRKVGYPVTYVRKGSNMSHILVKNLVDGEILRHRRLCSRAEFIEVNDDCLLKELQSRGYSYKKVRRMMRQRIGNLAEIYDDETWVRCNEKRKLEGLVYGAKMVYDGIWNTHKRLAQLLKFALPKGVRCVYIFISIISFCF